ncbi:hypothetical protein FKR81_02945 [Lentzea tibetensis]|uniref:FtsX-like permease family protein n=1 Tax=Lentzea tibetensis TaxID=2591470 RepID=A0A563F191_9PSEU|nr:hypothetical protein [Lentzea tibetensis]TWP53730.1 hypothetical protein FKR81_02945 [Lentzea tibetensis]
MRFAVRLMRNRTLTWSSAIMFVTAAVLVGLFIAVQAFALTQEQVAERDLGRFDAKIDLSAEASPDLASVRGAGGRDVAVSLSSLDIRPSVVDAPVTSYVETDWTAEPFPVRYSLVSGRWPEQPGEVVLNRKGGDTLAVPSATLRVVGVVHDRYSGWNTILAAPGTWAGFSAAGVSATRSVYWNGPADAGAALGGPVVTRQGHQPRSWVERYPLAYRIPALALPLLSVLAIFGLTLAWSRRTATLLHSIGVRQTYAVGVAATAWTMIWTVLGSLAGVGIGMVVRPILARDRDEPLSPLPGLLAPVSQILLVTLVACALYFRTGPRSRTAGSWTTTRRCLAILLGGVIVFQIARTGGVVGAMLLTATVGAAVLLLAPDVVRYLAGLLPRRDPRLRLGGHRLRDRGVSAVAVLTAVLAPPLAMMTLLATEIANQEAKTVPDAAPHQVVVSGRNGIGHAPPAEVLAAVTTRLSGTAIRTRFVADHHLLVVDSAEDVAALDGRPLTPSEVDGLRAGRILTFTDPTWRASAAGVVLAQHAGGAVDAAVVFTNVPDDDAVAAQQAVLDARLGHGFVLVHRPPEPAFIPASLYAVVIGLALIAVVSAATVARTQARTSRGYSARLTAIGVSRRWIRQVLLVESGVAVVVSVVLACVIAIPPMALIGLGVRVPWAQVGLLACVFCLAALMSGVRARAA